MRVPPLLVVLFAVTTPSVVAQVDAPLARRFEAAVRLASPESRLEPVQSSPWAGHQHRRWTLPDSSQISVSYWIHESADAASEAVGGEYRSLMLPTVWVPAFGDEAFTIAGREAVVFRRRHIRVRVDASGDISVINLARLLLAEVDRSLEAGDVDPTVYRIP